MSYPENQYVNFAIVRRNPKALVYPRYTLLVALTLIGSVIFGNLLPSFLQPGIVVACLALLIFLAIKQRSVRVYEEVGWIMMYPEFIAVRTGDVEVEYPIDNTTSITVELQGYTGQTIIGSYVRTKDGLRNFMSITNPVGIVRHEVLISNSMKIPIMERLLDHYQNSGVEVKLTNRSSYDSIESMFLRMLAGFRALN